MYAEERRRQIASLTAIEGRVNVTELAARFDVTAYRCIKPTLMKAILPFLTMKAQCTGSMAVRWQAKTSKLRSLLSMRVQSQPHQQSQLSPGWHLIFFRQLRGACS